MNNGIGTPPAKLFQFMTMKWQKYGKDHTDGDYDRDFFLPKDMENWSDSFR